MLREWKMAIILIEQRYKSMKSKQDYRIGTGMTYGERGTSIDIEKAKDNFNKDRKPKCFNYNIYRQIAKNYRKLRKE